jgi:hypothetical protein
MQFSKKPPTPRGWSALAAIGSPVMLLLQACDPVVSIDGAFFPAWMVSLITGIGGAALVRLGLIRASIDPHLKPHVVVYPCLALLITVSFWLLLYRQ